MIILEFLSQWVLPFLFIAFLAYIFGSILFRQTKGQSKRWQ